MYYLTKIQRQTLTQLYVSIDSSSVDDCGNPFKNVISFWLFWNNLIEYRLNRKNADGLRFWNVDEGDRY